MSTSIAEFWKTLEKSRLVGAEHCHALAEQFGQIKGVDQAGNAQTLAEWLVKQQAISRYQAKVLLAGKSGPFFYGGYVLFDKVSDGPLRSCFRAMHPATRHIVALNFFDEQTPAEEWNAAAETVLTAAAWQGHPHLQDLYQLQEQGKKRFTVLADQPGISLDKVLAKQQRLPPHEACRIVREMLLGLNTMHQSGAVHGAIRPVNILLAPETNQAVLLQPPVARPFWPIPGTVDLSPYTNEQLLVQVDYMAPELAHAGVPASPVSDIYAAGCLLYQLLSGRPPFAGGEVAAKFMRHASEPVQPLQPFGVPPQLAQVVMYTMAKDPAIRYQSAAQLIEALAFFVDPRAMQVVPQVAPTLSPFLGWLREQPAIPAQLDQELYGTAPATPTGATSFPAVDFGTGTRGAGRETKMMDIGGAGSKVNGESLAAAMAERKAKSQQKLFLGGIAALAVLFIGFVIYKSTQRDTPETETTPIAVNTPTVNPGKGKNPSPQTPTSVVTEKVPDPTPQEQPKAPETEPKASDDGKTSLIADDGNTLWASPTSGPPLNFSELPSSAQLFLSVRPWDLLNKNRFNPQLFAAAGPLAEMGRAKVEADVGLKFPEMQLLEVAWVEDGGALTPVYYVRAKDRAAAEKWQQNLGSPKMEMIGDKSVGRGPKLLYYWPAKDNGMRLIATYPKQMQELITAPARAHPKVERLLAQSDEQRLVNLIMTTSYLFAEGADALPGQKPLVKMFEQILSYDTAALSLSLHVDDQSFFTELKLLPAAGQGAKQAALLFLEKLRSWEPGATAFVGEALQKNNQAYGFNVLMALPRRVGKFASMVRADEDNGVVVVRSYLNAAAAPHLIQGAELALAYSGTGAGAPQLALGAPAAGGTTPGTPAAQPTGNTPADKLKKVISLTFDRDTLEKSMVMLGDELGTPIEIMGGDLQLEGITKNQSFGLDEKNKTGSEILQVIMKKANPDGKLVYIIKPKAPGGEDQIYITTRSAVAKRKDTLPPELVTDTKPPAKK
jgi:hypothetical protein